MPGDYVKRSDTLQAVGDIHPLDYNGQGIVERIKAIPAADVVEVVRCKDCIHRDPEDRKCDCGGQERQGCPLPVRGSYFCAYGKRKDGGQDDV